MQGVRVLLFELQLSMALLAITMPLVITLPVVTLRAQASIDKEEHFLEGWPLIYHEIYTQSAKKKDKIPSFKNKDSRAALPFIAAPKILYNHREIEAFYRIYHLESTNLFYLEITDNSKNKPIHLRFNIK